MDTPKDNINKDTVLQTVDLNPKDVQILLNNKATNEKIKKAELVRKRKRQNLEERKLREQKESVEKKRKADQCMKYLLSKSLKLANFFQERLDAHLSNKCITIEKIKNDHKTLTLGMEPTLSDELEKNENKTETNIQRTKTITDIDIQNQMKYFEGGVLKPFQLEGLTWMTILYENGVNGILADEMGLGKTVQVIALLCHLYEKAIQGPYLIIAPLSTLLNWEMEFKRFAPQLPVIIFHGNAIDRNYFKVFVNKLYKVGNKWMEPIVVTSYEMPLLEHKFFQNFLWQYVIIDEGHRIKNHLSKLGKNLRQLRSKNRLLLTGTPLQNNMTELWSLLNFLLPHIFSDMETFTSLLLLDDMKNCEIASKKDCVDVVATIHRVLAPFMLRRLKIDVLPYFVPKKQVLVYCPLTQLQKDLYSYVIEKNIVKLKGKDEEPPLTESRSKRKCTTKNISYVESRNNDIEKFVKVEEECLNTKISQKAAPYLYHILLQNTMMMFRKIVAHPYLVHFPLDPKSKKMELLVDENLVKTSGKMLVLDAMLNKLKQQNHKVLIFSTLVMALDLIEEYMIIRGYKYCRLDGNSKLTERHESTESFNKDPDILAFLISTRAGGLGLNLTGADTVILFDRDWNPQVDIQAQDRCHRMGQTKPVMVYSLVTKNTIDENVIMRCNQKRRLEKIIIRDGKFKSLQSNSSKEIDFEELKALLNSNDCMTKIHLNDFVFSDEELDKLLDRSELYEEMAKKDLNNIN